MTYTLKASGIATKATMVLAVDEGGTITEFVSSSVNSGLTIGAGVSVGTGSWKSVSRQYFQTANSGTGGITFGATKPSFVASGSEDCSFFMAVADLSTAAFLAGQIMSLSGSGVGSDGRFAREYGTDRIGILIDGGYRVTTSTAPATNTKFSAGLTIHGSSTATNAAYYGLESGSIASDINTNQAYGFTANPVAIGGTDFSNGKFYLIATFNDALTSEEWSSLHDDWFGTLLDAGASAVTKRLMTMGIGS